MTGIFRPGTLHANCDSVVAGGGGGGPATTWNPADASAGLLFSNANLTVAWNTGSTDVGARATLSHNAGKWVFEDQWNMVSGAAFGDTGAGVALASATFTGLGANATGGALIYAAGGAIWVNGVNWGLGGAGWLNGGWMMCAMDFTNGRIWFTSTNTPGTWNGNVANNPATNVGGLSMAAFAGQALYPVCTINNAGTTQSHVANFKAPFNNAVPAGFSAWGF